MKKSPARGVNNGYGIQARAAALTASTNAEVNKKIAVANTNDARNARPPGGASS